MATRSVVDEINFPVKTAFLDTSTNGSNTVIGAVTGRAIVVLSLAVISTLANSIKMLSNATQISSTMPLGANGGFVLPFNQYGWFTTASGEALNMNMTIATATGIIVTYIEK